MIDTDRLEMIDTGDGVPLTKCEQNLYEALANVQDGWHYENDESVNHACRDNTFVRLEDALAAVGELVAEAKQLRSIIDYIREVGKMDRKPSGHLLSIMEQVLTTEEYLEWRNEE